jgi:hypothetical protein
MKMCAAYDKKLPDEKRDTQYWLSLYTECYRAVYGVDIK